MYILIHSGSRGFGHQICQDTLNSFMKLGYAKGLPDKQLMAAPIQSEAGQTYFARWRPRPITLSIIGSRSCMRSERVFNEVLNIDPENIRLLYDVCHNIAKFEKLYRREADEPLCAPQRGDEGFRPGA